MKNKILLLVLVGVGGIYTAESPRKKAKTVKWADDRNKIHDQFEKHLDHEYYDQLPFEGDYGSFSPLFDDVSEWRKEYEEVLKKDIEKHLLLDYLDLEEEETLQAMALADGYAGQLNAFIVSLDEAIVAHDRATQTVRDLLIQEGKTPEMIEKFEGFAQSQKEDAQALRNFYLEKIKELEPFRTPR